MRRERFSALLTSVYVLYEASWPVAQPDLERIEAEAEQFVAMMHHLYDEAGSGSLDREAFDRAAHQHPLLVQAFQLEQLDMPIPPPAQPEAPSPLGSDRLRAKNGVYSGLRPGAVSRFDETYFDGTA